MAKAALAKAEAAIATLRSQVAELKVSAPVASEVYQIGAEPGEHVSPGCPCSRWSISATSGSASTCARISSGT